MDYGNTRTPSMHRRLGSATLSQLGFQQEKQIKFPIEEIPMENTIIFFNSISKEDREK